MKKFFYSLLIMTMAIGSAVSFVSCGSDDDIETPANASKVKFVAWVSNDVLDIADVVADGVNFSLNTPFTLLDVDGMSGAVEFTSKEAAETSFIISFKLKSNWEEILAKKDVFTAGYVSVQGKAETTSINAGSDVKIATISRKSIGDQFESKVGALIPLIKFRSK